MIGAILDVYFEGEKPFRACVFDTATECGLWVINLENGEKRLANQGEHGSPIIQNIFDIGGQ